MGMLDTFNTWQQDTDMESPNNQRMMAIAAALLQAGGPSLKPTSMGQALGGAMQYGQQAYQGAEDRSLLKQARSQELKMKQLAEKRAQQTFDQQQAWMKKLSGGGAEDQAQGQFPAQTGQMGSGTYGILPTAAGVPSIPNFSGQQMQQPRQAKSGIENMSLDDLGQAAIFGLHGAKELLDIKKFQMQGIKRDPNSIIERADGTREYIADPTKGMNYDPATNSVSGIKNWNEVNAAMKGSETSATEAAKAQYDFMPLSINQPVTLPSGQTLQPGTYNLSKAQIAEINRAQQAQFNAPQTTPQTQPMQVQAPTQGLPQPGNATQAELNQRSTQLRANQPQMDNDRLTILQQELAAERDPNNRIMLQREIANVGGTQAASQQFAPQAQNQSSFGIPLQSEAQKQAEIEAAKKSVGLQYDPLIKGAEGRTATDVEREKAKPAAYGKLQSSISDLNALIDEAQALYDHPGLSGMTGLYGKVPNVPGSNASNAKARLETLRAGTGFGKLQSMRDLSPTGGALGAVSDTENKLLQNSISSLDESQSEEAFKQSLGRLIDRTKQTRNLLSKTYEGQYGDTQSNTALQNVVSADARNLPKSKIVKIDGGGSAAAKLGADGNYYILQKNGKWAKVIE